MTYRTARQRTLASWGLGLVAALLIAPLALAAQSFGDWAHGLVADQAPLRWLVYSAATTAGVVAHYAKRVTTGELATPWGGSVSLVDYLWRLRVDRTVWMLIAQIGAGSGMALTGALVAMDWGALIVTAATTGYSLDSLINRSE